MTSVEVVERRVLVLVLLEAEVEVKVGARHADTRVVEVTSVRCCGRWDE